MIHQARYRLHPVALGLAAVLLLVPGVTSAQLRPETLEAFKQYARMTEQRIDGELADPTRFLTIDHFASNRRDAAYEQIRAGEVYTEQLRPPTNENQIEVPDGLIHHWLGAVFIPDTTVEQTLAIVQDYDRHGEIYDPHVVRGETLARDGPFFHIYLRFWQRRIITVVLDTEHEVRYFQIDPRRTHSRSYSTRILEVQNAGEPDERILPEGEGGGYLWRLYSYWRFEERNGGTYVQSETISLTRDIPFGLGWLIRPIVTGMPRDSLTFTLEATRQALLGR